VESGDARDPSPVRVLILRTAGTNCDLESAHAFALAGASPDLVHINRLMRDPALLDGAHICMIPGGFTYGDDLGAGKVLANEIRIRLLDRFRDFIRRGRLLLGVCNGFQVLVKAGLLPDPFDETPGATLGWNDSNRFEARWVYLRVCSDRSAFIRGDRVIRLPVAHGEGKFIPRDEATLESMRARGQIVLRYCDAAGRPTGYPGNPNGAIDHIAGLCDPSGHVLGLMPHPERYIVPTQHPAWTRCEAPPEPDGLRFFTSAVDFIRSRETASGATEEQDLRTGATRR
jgi:phosphoribosylformylglycinamidine synthase